MAESQERDSAGDGPLQQEITAFIPVVQHCIRTVLKQDLPDQTPNEIYHLLEAWNGFLVEKQDSEHTDALVSPDIRNDTEGFISSSVNSSDNDALWIRVWLPRWNSFLLARQGESLVTTWGAIATTIGVILYVGDMATDWGTAVYFAYTGQWWECVLTLCVVYSSVALSTVNKLQVGYVLWTGPLDTFRYWMSLLVNLPDLRLCWALLHAEWKLVRAPRSSAHLVPVWLQSRVRVAWLKLTECVCEACPQALLQLVLLLPELQGDITWTVYMRLVATAISLCAAGAALVNTEKIDRFKGHAVLPLGELIVLLVWAVPVTVCRLLCLALLLSVHLYWGLACIALHLALYSVYCCRDERVARTKNEVLNVFLNNVLFLVSPLDDSSKRPSPAMRHAIHSLGNAGVMVLWVLTTSLHCTQPVLYAVLIIIIPALFITGLMGWLLHWMCYIRPAPPSSSNDSA